MRLDEEEGMLTRPDTRLSDPCRHHWHAIDEPADIVVNIGIPPSGGWGGVDRGQGSGGGGIRRRGSIGTPGIGWLGLRRKREREGQDIREARYLCQITISLQ